MVNIEVTHEITNIDVVSTGTTTVDVSTTGIQGLTGPAGIAGPAGADSTVAGPATPVDFQGNGFPESVVTAAVGKTYRDNAATNGAILWVKATGTGNTGWRVVYGDIRRRLQNADLQSGWTITSEFTLHRQNNMVHILLSYIQVPATGQAAALYTLPVGFRPIGQAHMAVGSGNNTSGPTGTVQISNTTGLMSAPLSRLWGIATYATNDAWPATLPGIV